MAEDLRHGGDPGERQAARHARGAARDAEDRLREAALEQDGVRRHLNGGIRKVIVVPNKLINFVVG